MVVDQEKIAPEEVVEKDEQVEVAKDPQPAASPSNTHQQENVAMQTEQPAAATVAAAPTLALNHSAALLAILSDMNVANNFNSSEEQKDRRVVQDSYQAAANIISNKTAGGEGVIIIRLQDFTLRSYYPT